jgi:hypothetical protein
LFVPVEVLLNQFCKGAGQYDHYAVANRIGEKEEYSIPDFCSGKLEGDAQHGRHVGECAGTQGNTENGAEDKRGKNPLSLNPNNAVTLN